MRNTMLKIGRHGNSKSRVRGVGQIAQLYSYKPGTVPVLRNVPIVINNTAKLSAEATFGTARAWQRLHPSDPMTVPSPYSPRRVPVTAIIPQGQKCPAGYFATAQGKCVAAPPQRPTYAPSVWPMPWGIIP